MSIEVFTNKTKAQESKVVSGSAYPFAARIKTGYSQAKRLLDEKLNSLLVANGLSAEERVQACRDFAELEKELDRLFLPFSELAETYAQVITKWKQ